MFQKIIFFFILVAFAHCARSQSFFSPLPKGKSTAARSIMAGQDVVEPTQTAFRPIVNVGSYLIGSPDNALLTGGGISYQKLQFNSATGKWTALWSINALAWGKVQLNGTSDTGTFLYGLAGGFLNNLVIVGAATDGKKLYATAGFGINLNN
jgi:hypothetical protein